MLKNAIEKNCDHIVITGDVADNADEKDFLILRKILQTFNLLNPLKTSIIIGNHDIFGGVQTAYDVVNFPSKCMNVDYKARVHAFISYFEELFVGSFFPLADDVFPFAKEIKNFVLIGLNTIDEYSRIKNPFASNGKVNKTQFEALKTILASERFKEKRKIVLAHHHFYKNNVEAKSSESQMWNKIENYTMRLRGKKKLLNLFVENNIELVLHGHSHEMKDYFRKGIRFLNAGGSTDNDNKYDSQMYIIDINEQRVAVDLNIVKGTPVMEKNTSYEEIPLQSAVAG